MTEAKVPPPPPEKTSSAGTHIPTSAENDPLAIAASQGVPEASPPEILALKPNKAADATTGSDAEEAKKTGATYRTLNDLPTPEQKS